MDDAPERYVAPRTGLRQAGRNIWLAALFAVLAGAGASVLLFLAASLWSAGSRDDGMPAYSASLWFAVLGMMVFSALKRRWWLTLFFVLGLFPTAFVLFLVFAFPC